MKSFLKRLIVLLSILVVLGMLVMVSGLVPIKASSGHWPITKWLLSFASSRSIATHSAPIEVPKLDEPGIVRLGGAIYESNCQWCHGRPMMPHPPAVAGMTPSPPYLPDVIDRWDKNELFYIVQHGIKFAGMPAWPTQQREDEIWPVVAFLRRLAEMSDQEYRELLSVPTGSEAPPMVLEKCSVCHGVAGSEIASPRVPRLAGQNEAYLVATLKAYAAGRRHSGVMEPIAARLRPADIALIARWYAAKTRPSTDETDPSTDETDPSTDETDPSTDDTESRTSDAIEGDSNVTTEIDSVETPSHNSTAACRECHAPGNDPTYPVLTGQPLTYLHRQLELLKSRQRGGTGRQELMHPIVDKMNKDEMRAAVLEAF